MVEVLGRIDGWWNEAGSTANSPIARSPVSCSSAWLTQRRNQQCSPTAQEKFRLTTPSLLSRGTPGFLGCPRVGHPPGPQSAGTLSPEQFAAEHSYQCQQSTASQEQRGRLRCGPAGRRAADFDDQPRRAAPIIDHKIECVYSSPKPACNRKGMQLSEICETGADARTYSVEENTSVVVGGPHAGQLGRQWIKTGKVKSGLIIVVPHGPAVAATATGTYPVRGGRVFRP